MADQASARFGSITVQLSHLDKVLFPGDGVTKGDLVAYYRDMAPRMVPYLRDRPLVMGRYPDGITGEAIVQKNAGRHFPDWVSRAEVPKQGGTVSQVVGDKPATLVYLANQACIELHVFLSRLGALNRPDQLVFDLDPPDNDSFGVACRTALELRELLEGELRLPAYVKTTGGKGLHVHVPLRPDEDFDAVRDFAREAARVLVSRAPDRLTIEQRKDQCGHRIYLDVMRDAYAQTVIAPCAVRARPGATVAMPLHWAEVERGDLRPRQFTIRTAGKRLAASEDPWAGMARHSSGLAEPRRRLARLGSA